MRYLLVTQSKNVSLQALEAIAQASRQACDVFSPGWGRVPPTIDVLDSPVDVPPAGTIVADFVDKDQGDGTLAFHFQQNGLPAIEVDVQSILRFGGGILDDAGTNLSVSGAWQHELFETEIDPWASGYVQLPDGTFLALEVGDPAEAFGLHYDVDGVGKVHGADAVLPSYFYPDATIGPFSLSGQVGAPLENDGYQITLPAPAAAADVVRRFLDAAAQGREAWERGASAVAEAVAPLVHLNPDKYTPNLLAYRKHRIESGRGRGVRRLRAA